MSKGVFFISPCAKCKGGTRHQVLKEEIESGDSEYQYRQSYAIIECLGCGMKSFREVFQDIENGYPVDDDKWEVPETVQCYPKFDPNLAQIEDTFMLPELVREIYTETISSVEAGALTLAGLGLRGTIEAVCNDRAITGRNLEIRISKMASQGLISSNDADRLHAIRFLGNDAAHDIKKPSKRQISVALKIVNHLMQSVYLLELEADGKLDTIVTRPEIFQKMLNKHLKDFVAGSEFPLAAFLGKDMRRLGAGASGLEAQLLAEIASGNYVELAVGKVDNYAGSKQPLQHFVVQ